MALPHARTSSNPLARAVVPATMLVVLAGPARAEMPRTPAWEWRLSIGNDAFTEVVPPLDDQGFTSDLGFAVRHASGEHAFGATFRHRTITERSWLPDARRWDLVELFPSYERPLVTTSRTSLVVGGRAGLVAGGNLGGRWIQNGWHELSRTGPTLDEGLASEYANGRTFGLAAGVQARGTYGPPVLQAFAISDAQLATAAGVSSLEALIGGRLTRRGKIELGLELALGLGHYAVDDPNLALPGAYGTGGSPVIWRAGGHVAWRRFRLVYTYRANEGGSGEPIGTLDLIAMH